VTPVDGLPPDVLAAARDFARRAGIDYEDALSHTAQAWGQFPDRGLWRTVALRRCVDQRRRESGRTGPDRRPLVVLDEPIGTAADDPTKGEQLGVCDPQFAGVEDTILLADRIGDLPDDELASLFKHYYLHISEGSGTPKAVIFARALRHARNEAYIPVPVIPVPVVPWVPLTLPEVAALTFAAQGLTVDQIATAMHLSRNTIKTHLARLTAKLKADNTTHAVALALRAGWIL
jgi:DNA-binding CsgD family transcriptional regulator